MAPQQQPSSTMAGRRMPPLQGAAGRVRRWSDVLHEQFADDASAAALDIDAAWQRQATPHAMVGTVGGWYMTGKACLRRYVTTDPGDPRVMQLTRFLDGAQGPPNRVHGGSIAAAFDEAFSGAAIVFAQRRMGMPATGQVATNPPTVNLTVNYAGPVGFHSTYLCEASVTEEKELSGGRLKLMLGAELKDAATEAVTNTATAIFIWTPDPSGSDDSATGIEIHMDGPDHDLEVDELGGSYPFEVTTLNALAIADAVTGSHSNRNTALGVPQLLAAHPGLEVSLMADASGEGVFEREGRPDLGGIDGESAACHYC